MGPLDWLVLAAATTFVVAYGLFKGRGSRDMEGYHLSGRSMRWPTIALSIMATQASAITFLSTPGQAYADGMRFVQVYLGLPIAMVVLSVTAVPIFHRLKVYTAYEYLEGRFDLKTRGLAALLFLVQRGLAAGLTIYAPAIILSVILGWDLDATVVVVGALVVLYTASGGARAVQWTQVHQMVIIAAGMLVAFFMVLRLLPEGVSLLDATRVAGAMGRLQAIDFSFDLSNRYTFWSGLLGGLFLSLSYFGTDQSQVQRYLTGSSVAQSRNGLLCNGLVKVPMQFFILFLGALVLVFYQYVEPPIFFNPVALESGRQGESAGELARLEGLHAAAFAERREAARRVVAAGGAVAEGEAARAALLAADARLQELRGEAVALLKRQDPEMDASDTNYVFLSFVVGYLPQGVVGLLIAAILFASMSSTSAELNALASTTVVDVYKRLLRPRASERHYLLVSRGATVLWGLFAIGFAESASRLGSLVEAVNILGSLFYGTILGIFLAAFYDRRVGGNAVFAAALLAEAVVVACFLFTGISFLWYNLVGCVLVMLFARLLEPLVGGGGRPPGREDGRSVAARSRQ